MIRAARFTVVPVIAIAVLDEAAMDPEAHAMWRRTAHRRIIERALQLQCSGKRAPWVVEDGKDSVACRLDHGAAVRLDGVARQRIMKGERLRRPRFVRLR